ncbi:alternative ribosome rescue aminoacyl-tRNA hydrolase ArfB [Mariluticola halotolerans]|uniref:alternative ribosome rescue aminoacyl-tRNA hydrolase ArfB n=1 Tax=Mariluticola halotolerans TaxID=2909283 RepID=UPI0026E1D155|nr:alternative ribosome rescue aminoacyl-tRNA hydrolase ArfB [Mariluticola halotolerans]UJQ93109.1 aminoacyl-tRNA hydrolase [Mariluticola halotolerans]
MAEPIEITGTITLDPAEIDFSFVRSSGPGGQNVNKVSTAVQIRFDLKHSPSLPTGLKTRAAALAGTRLTNEGVIVLTASSFRSQLQNRQDAVARLVALLQQAAIPPKHRRKTRPSLSAKRKRVDAKTRRGAIKNLRRSKPSLD